MRKLGPSLEEPLSLLKNLKQCLSLRLSAKLQLGTLNIISRWKKNFSNLIKFVPHSPRPESARCRTQVRPTAGREAFEKHSHAKRGNEIGVWVNLPSAD
ncbi:hypothetical protein [Desulfonema magnum]|uniref:hypothetical protein n=1 Tax=Desulfonema magnum TaxID=45655 RepID=UPI001A9ADD7B|nr:hypothetical protein [Desulfonema magnum]